jgi:hypothetical protein
MRIGCTGQNEFEGQTLIIEFDKVFTLEIFGTKNNTYLTKIFEKQFAEKRVKFSNIYRETLLEAIEKSFEEVFKIFRDNKDYEWTEEIKNNKLAMVLEHVEKYYY